VEADHAARGQKAYRRRPLTLVETGIRMGGMFLLVLRGEGGGLLLVGGLASPSSSSVLNFGSKKILS